MNTTIMDRLKDFAKVKTFDEIAEVLNMTVANVYSYNTRKKIPYEFLVNYCDKTGLSLDWLIFGRGVKYNQLVKFPSTKTTNNNNSIVIGDNTKISGDISLHVNLANYPINEKKLKEVISLLQYSPISFIDKTIQKLKQFKRMVEE